jgi:FHA domain
LALYVHSDDNIFSRRLLVKFFQILNFKLRRYFLELMNLNLFFEQTGTSWTLKPNREYIVGSANDCHISLPGMNVVSQHHLKFIFNQSSNTWHVTDLGSTNGTFIENQRIADYEIQAQTRIAVAAGIVLVATPDVAIVTAQPPVYTPPAPSAPPVYSSASQPTYSVSSRPNIPQSYSPPMEMLTWKEYVEQQVQQRSNFMARIAMRFYLVTGFRNTPWTRNLGGYVLPNFRESAETVAIAMEEKIGQMTQYEDTDCYVARLTDAHIVNSATQTFFGVELFPIFRGKKPNADYRKFCVVSYHRVRTYLLVENYGSDLFVSWVTRFEPQPTVVKMVLWLTLAIILGLLGLVSQNLILSLVPFFIWCEIYLLVPIIMQASGILPKKANALLIIVLMLLITFILFITLSAISALNRTY